jgi:hypothetical protein
MGAWMSNDLIAWMVVIALGVAVVGLGWRRKLADSTAELAATVWRDLGAGDCVAGVLW